MKLKQKCKEIRDGYVIRQVQNISIPEFGTGKDHRCHMVFNGRVQHVGFRLEMQRLAGRLGLTGWAKNLPNGDVEVELQGQKEKQDFLLDFMRSLKRIKIYEVKQTDIPPVKMERVFQILS